MSFNLSKNGSGEIIKKSVSIGTTLQTLLTANPYIVSAPSSLFNNRIYDYSSPTISLTGGGTTTITQNNINAVSNITAGTTTASKALVLDNNKDITGINIIKCNSITVDGTVVPTEVNGGVSAPANDYFADNTNGTAVNNKAVVLGPQKTLSGVKKITGTIDNAFSYDRTGRSINVQLFKSTNLSSGVWKDCCYSLDLKKFACVGHGKVALSNNGSSWTEIVVSGVNFNKVYWASTLGLYFAVATDGIYESIDGTEWDLSLTSTGLEDIEVGNSFIIAIGTKMFTKSVVNGSQWNEVSMTAGMNTVSWKGIAFGSNSIIGSRFVVVGNNKMAFCLEAEVNTPASWTDITLTGLWNSVSYGNDIFIAVNSQSQPNNKTTTSTNGSIWSAMNLSWYITEDELTTTGFKSVKFFSQLQIFFVLTRNPRAGETRVYYTKNGHEWHNFKHQLDSHITSVCWAPDLGKVFGLGKGLDTSEDDNLAYCHTLRLCNTVYSTYGSTDYGLFYNMVSIEETGFVFACNQNGLFYSNDGKTFNKAFINVSGQNQLDSVSRRIFDVTYSSTLNLYIAGSEYSAGVFSNIISSTDGINWTEVANSLTASCIAVAWSPEHGRFYGNGLNTLAFSSDGVNWDSQALVGFTELSKVGSDIFVHGIHLTKRLFKINSDLSYTATNTVQTFNKITKWNNVLYSKVGTSIYTSSNDGLDWTELINFGVNILNNIIYNSDLDCLIIYSSDNMARVYKDNVWTTYTNVNYLPRNAGFKGCYSNYWRCLFIPSLSYSTNVICKTRSFFSQTCISTSMLKSTNEIIYKTIPDYSLYKRELADNIYTALNTNFTQNTTPTGGNAVRYIQYSRARSTWYALRTSPSSTVLTLSTVNNFATTSNYLRSFAGFDFGHNLNLWTVVTGDGNVSISLGDYPATTTTVSTNFNSAFYNTGTFTPQRIKVSYNKDFFYIFNNSVASQGRLEIHTIVGSISSGGVSSISISTQSIFITDGCYNSANDSIVYLTASPLRVYKYKLVNNTLSAVYISEFSPPAGTYFQLDFFQDANIYILTGTNSIYYSYDGETWTATPTTAMTSYTYSTWSMKYIPELKIMGIVANSMFAYTHDGVNWIVTPTSVSKLWTSFDYSPDYSILILHATGDGGILVSSPLYPTIKNTITPMNSITDKNCLSLLTRSAFMTVEKNNHALELNSTISLSASSKSAAINRSSYFHLDFSSNNIDITRTDTNSLITQSLKVNGSYLEIDNSVANSLSFINKWDSTSLVYKNSLLLLRNGENLVVNNLAASSLNITNSALSSQKEIGPVIADANLNVSLDNICVNSLSINGTTYSNSKENIYGTTPPPTVDPLLSIDEYMNFRNTQFYVGNASIPIMGSAYSEELNVMVIYTNANAPTITQFLNISKDRGTTWQRLAITNAFTYSSTTTEKSNKLIWLSNIKRFVLVQDNNVMFSTNGFVWEENAISFGTNPTIFYDSKLNRLTVSTTTKIAYANDINNLGGTWTIGTANTAVRMITYHSPLDRYFFRDNTNNSSLKATADIYSTTITSTDSAHGVVISDLLVYNDWVYSCGSTKIFRRNTSTTTISTEVFNSPNGSVSFRNLIAVPRLDMIVAFSNVSFAYTTNGTTWIHIPLSQELINYALNTTLEGFNSNMIWGVDRLYMITCTAGDLLESDIDNKQNVSAVEYLDVSIKNRMSLDNLHNSNMIPVNLFMRHSTTPRDMYATAYGNGYFLSVGTDVNMYSTSLKNSQTFETHNGSWRDIAFIGGNFVKVRDNTVSYKSTPISGSWTDITVNGNWVRVQKARETIIIYSSDETIKYANSITGQWNDITLPSGVSSSLWNNIKIPMFLDNKLFLLGNGYIANCDITYDGNQNASFGSWTVKVLDGNWNDISYSKNIYVVAGNGFIAKSRNLSYFRKTLVFRNYSRVIYSRLLGDFFLMATEVNSCTHSFTVANQAVRNNQTNGVIRTSDGVNWTSSFRISKFNTGGQLYNLSNIYYFEETDQFALPLNNSGTKIYIYSNYYIAHKNTTKITTPATLLVNNTLSNGSIDIARGDNLSMASPLLLNVFNDSAAKPATSTWTTVSDERLKENIVNADLELCLNNVKNIPLKYYKWKDEYISESQSTDRHKLGWIAQDVETVYPKAVHSQNMFGIEDCRTLDTDQLIASLYGAIKLLTKKIEEKEQAVADAE